MIDHILKFIYFSVSENAISLNNKSLDETMSDLDEIQQIKEQNKKDAEREENLRLELENSEKTQENSDDSLNLVLENTETVGESSEDLRLVLENTEKEHCKNDIEDSEDLELVLESTEKEESSKQDSENLELVLESTGKECNEGSKQDSENLELVLEDTEKENIEEMEMAVSLGHNQETCLSASQINTADAETMPVDMMTISQESNQSSNSQKVSEPADADTLPVEMLSPASLEPSANHNDTLESAGSDLKLKLSDSDDTQNSEILESMDTE